MQTGDRFYAYVQFRLQTTRAWSGWQTGPILPCSIWMEKVGRCQHKMKGYSSGFREIGDPNNADVVCRTWFEPTHRTAEPTSQFFQNRFADMDWHRHPRRQRDIRGEIAFCADPPKPELGEDAHELWTTYFCNIFNPTRPRSMR
jgi:DNA polymerase